MEDESAHRAQEDVVVVRAGEVGVYGDGAVTNLRDKAYR